MTLHTVEKIGGTSMSAYAAVRDNIIFKLAGGEALYQRILVVSAYAGITNRLLEHKKMASRAFMPYSPAVSMTVAGNRHWQT